MGRKLENIELEAMERAIKTAIEDKEEYEFKIELKQLQIDKGLEVNLRVKKKEFEAEIVTLKGNLDFTNTLIDKYSQCIETGHVEIDVDEEELKEDLDTE